MRHLTLRHRSHSATGTLAPHSHSGLQVPYSGYPNLIHSEPCSPQPTSSAPRALATFLCHLPPASNTYLHLLPHTSSLSHLAHPRTLASVLLSLEPEYRTLHQLPGGPCPPVQFDPQLTPREGSLSPSLPLVTLSDPSAAVKLPCPNSPVPIPPCRVWKLDHK